MPDVGDSSLTVAELERLLQAADPAVLLVPPRQLFRVIKYDRKITSIGLQVPHRKSYFINRERFLEIVDPSEIEPGRALPAKVVLIAKPLPERLATLTRDEALVKYWRLLFHVRVHVALEEAWGKQRLTDTALRERIHHIGQAEFDEIRRVLRQEKFLLPPRDDRIVYEEFAALYLELSFFAATLLPRYFPSVADFAHINELLARDVDAKALFAKTRPAGAPDPVFAVDNVGQGADSATEPSSPSLVSPEQARRLLEHAEKAAARGNNVRAALRKIQAEATPSEKLPASARAELDHLVDRLRTALDLNDAETETWRRALPALLERAARGLWPVEARLLYDLQRVCVAHERTVYKPNLVGWLFSWFRRPLLEPLPHQPAVLAVKHLRRAMIRLPSARLAELDRHVLTAAIKEALHDAEARLRRRFRPLVEQSLLDAGLAATNLPEQVAFLKVVEELLDRITERGLLTIGDLRDALSRNQLKLPDLAGPGEFVRGDALLRANRRLAEAGKGVYRYGEFYLRWLQRLSAAAFGTPVGRFLTLFLAIPFGGSFIVWEGLQYAANKVRHLAGYGHGHADDLHFVDWPGVVGFGFFLMALIHLPVVRRWLTIGLHWLGRGLHVLVAEVPGFVLRLPMIQEMLQSRPFLLIKNFVLKPGLVTLPAWWFTVVWQYDWPALAASCGSTFLLACLLINSRLGRDLQEMGEDWASRAWESARDLAGGVVRFIQEIFKTFLEAVDRLLYTVDEWLRFRSGESRWAMIAKVILSPLWGAVAYFVRMLLLMFVEPQVNPIKHFPVVTVSHKMLFPLEPTLQGILMLRLELTEYAAHIMAVVIIGKVPGVFGFLVWELKENWRLYAVNRAPSLTPVLIGHHGETMLRFMKPGFHSGTLPKLYGKLRRAERRAHRSGDWRAARKLRESLHHVEESIEHFVDREFVTLLRQCPSWGAAGLCVADVEAASNRVRIELACPELGEKPLAIAFEEQSGWLLATVLHPGWLEQLSPAQRRLLESALAGLYKLAGVDMVREQLQATLPAPAYDLAEEGLVVWPGRGYEIEAVYDLRDGPLLRPRVQGLVCAELPSLEVHRLLFRDQEISWAAWVDFWENAAGTTRLLPEWVRLLPLPG